MKTRIAFILLITICSEMPAQDSAIHKLELSAGIGYSLPQNHFPDIFRIDNAVNYSAALNFSFTHNLFAGLSYMYNSYERPLFNADDFIMHNCALFIGYKISIDKFDFYAEAGPGLMIASYANYEFYESDENGFSTDISLSDGDSKTLSGNATFGIGFDIFPRIAIKLESGYVISNESWYLNNFQASGTGSSQPYYGNMFSGDSEDLYESINFTAGIGVSLF